MVRELKKKSGGRKERNKEENARTKVRNRERFLMNLSNAHTSRGIIIIYCCILRERERGGERGRWDHIPRRSSSAAPLPPCPVLVPPFSQRRFQRCRQNRGHNNIGTRVPREEVTSSISLKVSSHGCSALSSRRGRSECVTAIDASSTCSRNAPLA